MSAALLAYLAARKRHKAEKERRNIDAVIDALKDEEDHEADRAAAVEKKAREAEATLEKTRERQRLLASESFAARWRRRLFSLIDSTAVVQYIWMLLCFQSLSGTIRINAEFYLDGYVGSMIVANTFDHHHYSFRYIRRPQDIFGWIDGALTPAIFHNMPAEQTWPDGDGTFSLVNATPLTTANMVDEANTFALPEGVVFKQLRVAPNNGANKLAINPNTAAGSSDAGGAASKRADSVFGNFSYSKETDGADPAARAAGLAAELDRSASMK